MSEPKTFAFVLFPGLTPLDLVVPLQVMSLMATLSSGWRVCVVAGQPQALPTDTPLTVTATHTFEQIPHPDAVMVPGGGEPAFAAMASRPLITWLHNAAEHAELLTSVCTGSLILGTAGLLEGRKATTHWAARHLLLRLGATPATDSWVQDGPLITASGVSASLDMSLHIVGKLAGQNLGELIRQAIEYDPAPSQQPPQWDTIDRAPAIDAVNAAARTALADHPELLSRLAV
ncbi:DJ-1/PfpI family protein [Nonomuraea sp. NPDC049152]|uniref:DJ-1/PfpI family protein n=1 Tax=Nonomuraea sp. NPDC049152 TaxID=3154350 RepID=UPI0033DDD8B5